MTPYDARLARVMVAIFYKATLGQMRLIEAELFNAKLDGPAHQRRARCAMVLPVGIGGPTLARIEALVGITYLTPPPGRYEPCITVETRVPWADDREDRWMGQDSGIED